MKLYIFILIFISLIFESFGDYFAKINNYILSFLFYMMMIIFWLFVVRYSGNITIPGMIWLICGQIILIIIGYGIFRENISINQWIGIGLASISIILMTK